MKFDKYSPASGGIKFTNFSDNQLTTVYPFWGPAKFGGGASHDLVCCPGPQRTWTLMDAEQLHMQTLRYLPHTARAVTTNHKRC